MKRIDGVIKSENGLTARLSAQIVAEANRFKSDIIIIVKDETADLKSIMNVMALIVPFNSPYSITIEGSDENLAYNNFNKILTELNLK